MTEPHEQDVPETEDVPLAPDEQEQTEEEEAAEEQAPEQETIKDDLDIEKAKAALAKEDTRHANRISEIMGEDAQALLVCPLCTSSDPAAVKLAGFRFNMMPQGEQLAAVKEAIGEPVTPEYEKDRYSNICSACGGYGRTRTGSRVAGQGDVQCLDCKGRGWVAVGVERESGALTAANGAQVTATGPIDLAAGPEPPEAAALKALGYIVVAPVPQGG